MMPWLALVLAMGCSGDGTMVTGGGSSGDTGSTTAGDGMADTTVGDGAEQELVVDPPGLTASLASSCELADDGTLTCWGSSDCGLFGNGNSWATPPVAATPDHTWASTAGGLFHACAIAEDRSLWCWGNASEGRVGDGILHDPMSPDLCRSEPFPVAEGTQWARLSLGFAHSCGVQLDGTLSCWGDNEFGQIGDGTMGFESTRTVPTEVPGGPWIDVYAGFDHSCAIDSVGALWCWGAGGDGQLGTGGLESSAVPLLIPGVPPLRELARGGSGTTTCAVDVGDGLWCWGSNEWGDAGVAPLEPVPTPSQVLLAEPIDHVSVGFGTTCAVGQGTTMWCWGRGDDGQLGDGVSSDLHSSPTPLQVPGSGWTQVIVGVRHVCGRTSRGETLCWGRNASGEVGDGTSGYDNARLEPALVGTWGGGPVADDWASGHVGGGTGCGLRVDGSAWCWGQRGFGQLGNGDVGGCSPNPPFECDYTTPVPVAAAGSGAWVELRPGGWHTCGRQDDGTLWCWGLGEDGQLGAPSKNQLVPTQVGTASDWIAMDVGLSETCGIRAPGALLCWGRNFFGQLGQDTGGASVETPTAVGMANDWTAISIDESGHACGLRSDDTLWCWGRNASGELGIGVSGDPQPVPAQVPGAWAAVDAGSLHTCAIATDGTLWCWGLSFDGRLGIGPTEEEFISSPTAVGVADDWVEIEVGSVSCGRRSNGTLWCWGSNGSGQLGQGDIDEDSNSWVPIQVGVDADWDDLSVSGATVCGHRGTALWCWGDNRGGQQGNDTVFPSGQLRQVRDDG
ncbi:MAG: hypothetical protein K0V04_35615 [Deltaproteobacteria bacterium]|nr:hypothetical protein [Deltaproteobacteria bacterium]